MVTWQNTLKNSTKVFATHVAQFLFFSIHLNQIIVFWHHHCRCHDRCFSSLSSCTVPGCSLKGIAFVALLQLLILDHHSVIKFGSIRTRIPLHDCWLCCTQHMRDVIFKLCTFFSINYCEMTIIS